jgi:hypothetical protein
VESEGGDGADVSGLGAGAGEKVERGARSRPERGDSASEPSAAIPPDGRRDPLLLVCERREDKETEKKGESGI